MNCSSMPGSSGGVTVISDNCFAQRADQAARHEGDEIGARGDMQRLDIAGHDQRDAPLDPLAAQPALDQILVLAADDDGDVPCVQENIAPPQLRADRMAAPHRERVAVGIEKLAVKSLEGVADARSRDRSCARTRR